MESKRNLTEMSEMKIRQFVWDILDANSWLLTQESHGLLFDPIDSPQLYSAVNKLDDLLVILTHSHFDHICGLNHIRQVKQNVVVIATEKCSEQMQSPRKNLSSMANAILSLHYNKDILNAVEPFACDAAEVLVMEKYNFDWCGHSVRITEYNGHTSGSLCCVIDSKFLFSGDTLLHMPTTTRLPGGSTEKFLQEDLPRLQKMIGSIECVYPGHGVQGDLEEMLAEITI